MDQYRLMAQRQQATRSFLGDPSSPRFSPPSNQQAHSKVSSLHHCDLLHPPVSHRCCDHNRYSHRYSQRLVATLQNQAEVPCSNPAGDLTQSQAWSDEGPFGMCWRGDAQANLADAVIDVTRCPPLPPRVTQSRCCALPAAAFPKGREST